MGGDGGLGPSAAGLAAQPFLYLISHLVNLSYITFIPTPSSLSLSFSLSLSLSLTLFPPARYGDEEVTEY